MSAKSFSESGERMVREEGQQRVWEERAQEVGRGERHREEGKWTLQGSGGMRGAGRGTQAGALW